MTTPVVAIFLAKPGWGVALEALFWAVIPPTLKEGCISYQFNRDLDEPRCFVWTEEWTSRAALNAHFATPHLKDLLARIQEHVESAQILALDPLVGVKA